MADRPESLADRVASIRRVVEMAGVRAEAVAAKHRPFASAHEAYGVIAEEVAELFDEVRKKDHLRSRLAMRNELLDIACAAIRAAAELEASDAR